jgi:hypothetical protein
MFLEQQITEALLESIDFAQDGELIKIGLQLDGLFRLEIVTMAAHQREQAAMFGSSGVDVPPAGQEVVIDEADDMEAIGDDPGLGEVLADDGAIHARQIHTHDSHPVLAGEFRQVVLQGGLAAAQHHIKDFVALKSQKVVA